MTPLKRVFEENVRPFIDLVDTLREIGLQNDISLPTVVVIGDQSSGKSSVLEAISGVQLPRGTGIMTRCPLELKMKCCEQWSAKLQYNTLRGERIQQDILIPDTIETAIMNAQNEMTKTDKDISEQLISLSVKGRDVPNLSLIDLPGIARLPVKGQAKDICERIKKIIFSYVSQKNTVMLCVIPSNQDVATIESLNIAREVDPFGTRTLGVLTKPDLIDKGAEKNILNLISNKVYKLEKGFSVIKCRSQQDIENQVSVKDARINENEFFNNSEIFRPLIANGTAGVNNLAEKLVKELLVQIKYSLPQMQKQLHNEINCEETELYELGKGIPQTVSEKQELLIDIGLKISKHFEKLVQANYYDRLYDDASPSEEHRIYSVVYRDVFYLNDLIDKRKISPDDEGFLKKIRFELKAQRGVELPAFLSYNVCKHFIRIFLNSIKNDISSTIRSVEKNIWSTLLDLVKNNTSKHRCLTDAFLAEVHKVHSRMVHNCEEAMKIIFEQEYLPFTLNMAYNTHFITENEDLEIATKNSRANIFCQNHTNFKKISLLGIMNYFRGRRRRNANCPPQHCIKCLKANAIDIKTSDTVMAECICSYLKVATSRLMDNIAMTIIYHLLTQNSQQIERTLIKFAADSSNCQLIYDDPHLVEKQNSKKIKIERLRNGLRMIERF